MSEKIVSAQRIAEIAERLAANQQPDTPGLNIASIYRCIATVFRQAAGSTSIDEVFRQAMTEVTGATFRDVTPERDSE